MARFVAWIVPAVFVLGGLIVAAGVALVYVPAGVITLGVFLAGTAVLWSLAESTSTSKDAPK